MLSWENMPLLIPQSKQDNNSASTDSQFERGFSWRFEMKSENGWTQSVPIAVEVLVTCLVEVPSRR